MHILSLGVFALQAASTVLGNPLPQTDDGAAAAAENVDQLTALAQAAYQKSEEMIQSGEIQKRGSSCSLGNIKIRKEWGSLQRQEKLDYIKAVQCLQSKPALTPSDIVPGAKSRFDDFVATHINQTFTIHYTGTFLSWHRRFTWLYEEALREECGYKGTQPYWDWAKTAVNGVDSSPIFDGTETSMSGNGEFIPDQEDIILTNPDGSEAARLPTGTGGGCITSGPFKNMSRDLTTAINRRYSNASAILHNILVPQNVGKFQVEMQGDPESGTMGMGIHGGGHFTLGGDPGRDFFVSPGDPAFYLHHAQIDRVWWMWQMLSPNARQFADDAVMGTNTFLNSPPSANTTLDEVLEYGYAAGPPIKIRDTMSTLAGPYCYIYL
ncbi:tyrosinase [Colletotrichum scovillei]|nr:tyrosinase [Colletotrichum scovillei]